jgi:hypothetical protein
MPLHLSNRLLPSEYHALCQCLHDLGSLCEYALPTVVLQICMVEMCRQYILSDLLVM